MQTAAESFVTWHICRCFRIFVTRCLKCHQLVNGSYYKCWKLCLSNMSLCTTDSHPLESVAKFAAFQLYMEMSSVAPVFTRSFLCSFIAVDHWLLVYQLFLWGYLLYEDTIGFKSYLPYSVSNKMTGHSPESASVASRSTVRHYYQPYAVLCIGNSKHIWSEGTILRSKYRKDDNPWFGVRWTLCLWTLPFVL